jgi:trans-aconitate methyltransferase
MAAVGAVTEPYHRFVFDLERRTFVGAFEEMYRREDAEGYDSWHQEDVNTLYRRVALALLAAQPWARILDFGCGKGAFTSLLKTADNHVVGVDVSETALAKAAARDPRVEWRRLARGELGELASERFDLVVAMEVLSYLEDWRETLQRLAQLGVHVFVSLYVPSNPIGFVKSLDDLRTEVARHAEIEAEALVNREQAQILARSRPA